MVDSVHAERLTASRQLISAANGLLDDAERRLIETKRELTIRDGILIALAHKMLRTFEALVDDAERNRSEAMHHLKTLCETYIYLRYTLNGGEEAARRLLGKALGERSEFLKRNGLLQPDALRAVEAEVRELSGHNRLPRLADVAKGLGPDLREWYDRVYRLACQPAHLGDLNEFLPHQDIRGDEVARAVHAQTALDYGAHLIFNAASLMNHNEVGIRIDVDTLRTSWPKWARSDR